MATIVGFILIVLFGLTATLIITLTINYIFGDKEDFHNLRKNYPNLFTYEVRLSEEMFGPLYCKDPICTLKAFNPEHAMKRFLVWHVRARKYHHQAWNSSGEVYETTCGWGTVAITCTETGFTSYFH